MYYLIICRNDVSVYNRKLEFGFLPLFSFIGTVEENQIPVLRLYTVTSLLHIIK
jgi:hypothetical protein